MMTTSKISSNKQMAKETYHEQIILLLLIKDQISRRGNVQSLFPRDSMEDYIACCSASSLAMQDDLSVRSEASRAFRSRIFFRSSSSSKKRQGLSNVVD